MATDNMQKSMRLSVVIPVTALVGLILIGAFFINVYINTERERDLQQWEARLGLVADAKIDAVQNFLSETFDDLQVLADNASLQLYLGELLQARASGSSQPAEFTYLRNLILASANRYGYWSDDTPRIAANIVTTSISGLALLDIDLHPVVATPGMPAVGEQMTEPLRRVLSGVERQATGLVPDGQEQAVIIFAVPVMAVMGSHPEGGDTPIGLLVTPNRICSRWLKVGLDLPRTAKRCYWRCAGIGLFTCHRQRMAQNRCDVVCRSVGQSWPRHRRSKHWIILHYWIIIAANRFCRSAVVSTG
ncbi:MAG: hypothetical protein QGG54_09825, partial [Gammaproteobacteria bacterium]|nr:hypothetical protein [Gammaproteobacteria bacterium]